MADGAINLGSAYGELGINTSGIENALEQAFGKIERTTQNAMERVGSRIEGIGNSVSGVGTAFMKWTAPITAIGALGLRTFGSFDDALTEIQARTGATADEMDKVRAKALQMGKETSFSATQASEAMLQLLASGYDLNETFTALPAVLNAAAAGGMDLGFTADTITDILAMFNLEADKAGGVADALARASAASSAEINDLAQGFGNVGPLAAQFGLSVEETAAILAAFSERGIKGAEAGTQLRSMLNNMTRDTEDVTGAWEKLGTSLYDAQGNVRPLNDVLGEMRVKLDQMSPEERTATIRALGGSFGQLGLSVLTSSDAMGDMVALMGDQADASTVAQARLKSFNGMVSQLRSTVETLLITALGPMIEQYLKPAIGEVTAFLNKVIAWVNLNPKLTATIVGLLTALVSVGPVLFGIGKAMVLVGKAVGMTGKAFALLSGPIGWILLAVGGLYLAWTKNFLGIRDALMPVVDTLQYVFGWLKKAFEWGASEGGIFGGIVASLRALFYVYEDGKTTFFSKILQSFGMTEEAAQKVGLTIVAVKDWIVGAFQTIAGAVSSAVTFVSDIIHNDLWNELNAIWDALKVGDIGGVLEGIRALFRAVVNVVLFYLPELKSKLLEWAGAFLAWVGPLIPPLLKALAGLAKDIWDWIKDTAPDIAKQLLDWAEAFVEWIAPMIADVLEALPDLMTDILKWILDTAPDIIAQIAEWAAAFVDWIGPAATKAVQELGKLAEKVVRWLVYAFIPKIAAEVPGIVKAVIQFAIDATTKIVPELWKFLIAVLNFVWNMLAPAIWNSMKSIGTSIVNGIKQGVNDAWDGFTSWLSDKASGIKDFIKDPLGIFSPSRVMMDIGANIVEGLARGLENTLPVDRAMMDLAGSLTGQAHLMVSPSGLGGGGTVTNYFTIQVPVTEDVLRRYPDAREYANTVGEGLEQRLSAAARFRGGGVSRG